MQTKQSRKLFQLKRSTSQSQSFEQKIKQEHHFRKKEKHQNRIEFQKQVKLEIQKLFNEKNIKQLCKPHQLKNQNKQLSQEFQNNQKEQKELKKDLPYIASFITRKNSQKINDFQDFLEQQQKLKKKQIQFKQIKNNSGYFPKTTQKFYNFFKFQKIISKITQKQKLKIAEQFFNQLKSIIKLFQLFKIMQKSLKYTVFHSIKSCQQQANYKYYKKNIQLLNQKSLQNLLNNLSLNKSQNDKDFIQKKFIFLKENDKWNKECYLRNICKNNIKENQNKQNTKHINKQKSYDKIKYNKLDKSDKSNNKKAQSRQSCKQFKQINELKNSIQKKPPSCMSIVKKYLNQSSKENESNISIIKGQSEQKKSKKHRRNNEYINNFGVEKLQLRFKSEEQKQNHHQEDEEIDCDGSIVIVDNFDQSMMENQQFLDQYIKNLQA